MKPIVFFLMIAVSSFGFSASAQKIKGSEPVTKTISLKENFTSLVINGDINVVLTEDNKNEIIVRGDEGSIKLFRAQVDDARLVLSYFQLYAKPDFQVFVPARFLNKIIINGKSELSSASVLSNSAIKVVIGGESKVYLRSIGKVIVEGTDEYDFVSVVR